MFVPPAGTSPPVDKRKEIQHMAYETLTVEKKEKYLLITLNRPPVNAINVDLLKELGKVLDNEDGDDVLSVVITGAGDKAFCAGADLKSGFGDKPGDLSRLGQDTFSRLENLGKPVIAAVNGLALGGGCELALACTFRIADEYTQRGSVEIDHSPSYRGWAAPTRPRASVALGYARRRTISATLLTMSRISGVACSRRSKMSIGFESEPWTSMRTFSTRCGSGRNGASASSTAAGTNIQ